MTIPLTTSGGLFVRMGHIGGVIGIGTTLTNPDVNSYIGTTVPNKIAQLLVDFAATPDNSPTIDGIYQTLTQFQQGAGSILQPMQLLAGNLVQVMANQDTPLSQVTIRNALQLLITQMQGASASVNASVPTVGSQTAVGSPTGNPVIVVSTKNGQGLTLQYLFPETLTFTCTQDSYSGGATAAQELMNVAGAAAVQSPLSFSWPGGSGSNISLNACDSGQNNAGTSANLLVNGDFLTWTTTNVPDNWTLGPGVAGTDIFKGTPTYDGGFSLQFTGTGSALLDAVTQQFNHVSSATPGAGGSPAILAADTPYALNGWVSVSATPSAGVLEFALVNGSGTIIQDDQGTNNSFTKSLTALTSSWVNVNGVFRLPALLPAAVYMRVRLSTAIDSGKSVYIDRLALNQMQPIYPIQTGSPYVSIFSGSTKLLKGDQWTIAIGNTYGGFQKLFERVFGMRQLNLQLPNSGSPTVSDTLIA